MSRIYFHTPDRTAELRGSERAYMNCLAGDMALAVLHLNHTDKAWLETVTVGASDVFERDEFWHMDWSTRFRIGDLTLRVNGDPIGSTELAYNTLIATRSPALSLLARIGGMCEDHAWIAEEDAGWLADTIEASRAENVLRPGQDWEDVADLARDVSTGATRGPIVLSFSVCDGFPNRYVCGEPWFYPWATNQEANPTDETAESRWYELPSDEQWRIAVEAIGHRKHTRQIGPALQDVGFMSGASAFDLIAARWEARV